MFLVKFNHFEKLGLLTHISLAIEKQKTMFWFYYAEFILLPLIFSAEVAAFAFPIST